MYFISLKISLNEEHRACLESFPELELFRLSNAANTAVCLHACRKNIRDFVQEFILWFKSLQRMLGFAMVVCTFLIAVLLISFWFGGNIVSAVSHTCRNRSIQIICKKKIKLAYLTRLMLSVAGRISHAHTWSWQLLCWNQNLETVLSWNQLFNLHTYSWSQSYRRREIQENIRALGRPMQQWSWQYARICIFKWRWAHFSVELPNQSTLHSWPAMINWPRGQASMQASRLP